jgi:hypothetical protein
MNIVTCGTFDESVTTLTPSNGYHAIVVLDFFAAVEATSAP